MPKDISGAGDKNVIMNIHGVDFELSDTNFNHFKSQTKNVQEAIKQIILLKISLEITNNINDFLDDENLKHYQSLTKLEQKEIKQSMILELMKNLASVPF